VNKPVLKLPVYKALSRTNIRMTKAQDDKHSFGLIHETGVIRISHALMHTWRLEIDVECRGGLSYLPSMIIIFIF